MEIVNKWVNWPIKEIANFRRRYKWIDTWKKKNALDVSKLFSL